MALTTMARCAPSRTVSAGPSSRVRPSTSTMLAELASAGIFSSQSSGSAEVQMRRVSALPASASRLATSVTRAASPAGSAATIQQQPGSAGGSPGRSAGSAGLRATSSENWSRWGSSSAPSRVTSVNPHSRSSSSQAAGPSSGECGRSAVSAHSQKSSVSPNTGASSAVSCDSTASSWPPGASSPRSRVRQARTS